MDIGKALLVKSSRDLLTQLVFVTATNASHRYPRGRDQNQYKFTVRWRYYWKTIVKTHKIRSTLYTGSTLRKLFYKPKHWVTTEDKNVFYENNSSNCESVYFGESHKIFVRNCDCDKNEIAKHCREADHNFSWDQKKVVDRESRSIPMMIKKTYILWRILIMLTKFPTCFMKYGFLIYDSS